MELERKPFQGVLNIIHFNWHYYLIAGFVIVLLIIFLPYLPIPVQPYAFWLLIVSFITISFSLIVSYFIYDISDFYQLNWLLNVNGKKILNINAGFDETSEIIQAKFPDADLMICDFYHPKKHTEVSIKRARKAYPPIENTIEVSTEKLPFLDHSLECVVAILSVHEIRDVQERIGFFSELNRVTTPSGQIFVTEHLRDLNNFLAYTIGFFHFHSKSSWLQTFERANLKIKREIKSTPFITTFILEKNGNTH